MKCAVAGADNYQTGDSRGQEISIKKPFILSGSEYQPRPRVSSVHRERVVYLLWKMYVEVDWMTIPKQLSR